ncbi:type II secretion system protein [Halarcobacter sp.]|uniref:type II secretion system protein n=1 Tax=Halarcobacter sp. TaxID=2321133 RepID=UPI003A92F1FA
MKNSFSILELILVLFILSLVITTFYFKPYENKLLDATNRIELYLKQTRYQALIDNKEKKEDSLWFRKRWTFKFFNCANDKGIYYVIYSDENKKGHPNENESLLDPLTKKRVYSSNSCEYDENRSKYVLLTKEFDIVDTNITCNSTKGLGQLSFGNDGKVYSRLSTHENRSEDYEIKNSCYIELINKLGQKKSVKIEPNTAFIGINKQ